MPEDGTVPQIGSPHGSLTTYVRGCRCDECRAASTVYMRDYRARRIAAGERIVRGTFRQGRRQIRRVTDPLPRHGTVARYVLRAGPCRCDECRAANARETRHRRWATNGY